jgi:hypothetical protein
VTIIIEDFLNTKVEPTDHADEQERLQRPDERSLKDAVARLVHNFDYFPNFTHGFL